MNDRPDTVEEYRKKIIVFYGEGYTNCFTDNSRFGSYIKSKFNFAMYFSSSYLSDGISESILLNIKRHYK